MKKIIPVLVIIYNVIREIGKTFLVAYDIALNGYDTYVMIGRAMGYINTILVVVICLKYMEVKDE